MQVTADKVVSIDYTLRDNEGNVLDTSDGREPLDYLHGHKNIIPGLESELEGRSVGDSLKVEIPPENGYGERDDNLIMEASRNQFPAEVELKAGMQFQADTPQGPRVFRILDVEEERVRVDGNHPLAGATLHFDVEVKDIRDASNDEVQAGRVIKDDCGPGCGCHH